MADLFRPDRRSLLQVSLAAAGMATLAKPAFAAASGGDAAILAAAREGLQRAGGLVAHRDLVGVADFSQASKAPRFHLVDVANGRIDSLLVAHGRGSDPSHTGFVKTFSKACRSLEIVP